MCGCNSASCSKKDEWFHLVGALEKLAINFYGDARERTSVYRVP